MMKHAFLVLAIVITIVTCLTSCTKGPTEVDGDRQYWEVQIFKAEKKLAQEDLSPEEKGACLTGIARAYSGLGDEKTAVSIWTELLSETNTDKVSKARARYRLALLDEQKGNWVEAIAGYRKYVSLYSSLSEDETDKFSQTTEHGDVVGYHVGELLEFKLHDLAGAENQYVNVVTGAMARKSLKKTRLTFLLGDFYFRHANYEQALKRYQEVSALYALRSRTLVIPVTKPAYKAIMCLQHMGRTKEAQEEYEKLAKEWDSSKSSMNREYVQKTKEFLDREVGDVDKIIRFQKPTRHLSSCEQESPQGGTH